jgi:hypothetical protein
MPNDEAGREIDRPYVVRRVTVANLVQEDPRRDPADLAQIPCWRTDRRCRVAGEIRVANTDERDVARVLNGIAGEGVHHAGKHMCAQRDDRGRPVGTLRQLAHVAEDVLDPSTCGRTRSRSTSRPASTCACR